LAHHAVAVAPLVIPNAQLGADVGASKVRGDVGEVVAAAADDCELRVFAHLCVCVCASVRLCARWRDAHTLIVCYSQRWHGALDAHVVGVHARCLVRQHLRHVTGGWMRHESVHACSKHTRACSKHTPAESGMHVCLRLAATCTSLRHHGTTHTGTYLVR